MKQPKLEDLDTAIELRDKLMELDEYITYLDRPQHNLNLVGAIKNDAPLKEVRIYLSKELVLEELCKQRAAVVNRFSDLGFDLTTEKRE